MSKIDEVKKGWNNILERSKEANYIVVVGAASGTDVQSFLIEEDILISEYFDNNELFIGTSVNGIRVSKPYKVNSHTSHTKNRHIIGSYATLGI